jgi:hypothetical protein
MLTTGPITRSAGDLMPLLRLLAGCIPLRCKDAHD